MPFDPSDEDQDRYAGYGLAPFPDPRDAEINFYLAGVRAVGAEEVQAAITEVSVRGRQVLLAYAERSASIAVRNNVPDRLIRALIALVIGGLTQNALEALMRTALVEDAARRLRAEPADVFAAAADLVGEMGAFALKLWLGRRPEDRTPEVMGFTVTGDGLTFRYEWAGDVAQ
ncbi:MAG: hypothetical protein DLM59_12275 [Pseudonocardiales bacterium]|nr:MAG: hypothetical protein DLM59_12275 [Pseudonocardiales bacterium]